MSNILPKNDWQIIGSVGEDGSTRKYFRVSKNGKTAILMDCSGPKVPGHDVADFVTIAHWLRSIGLNAPEIYERGEDDKYVLLEDFGELSYKAAVGQSRDVREMYGVAADVLKHLARHSCPLQLPNYNDSHVHKGHRRVIDWYLPSIRQRKNGDGVVEKYLEAWDEIEKSLPPCGQGFVHVDFHAENLMWLPDQKNLFRCGILDFQGAMHGPIAYDLANLLEDPRQVIDPAIRHDILKSHDDEFLSWYRVLATQFHCRVIGQFIKLAMNQNKTRYLSYIPALENYLRQALKDPVLAPLKAFFSDIGLDFGGTKDLNAALKPDFIRSDAC